MYLCATCNRPSQTLLDQLTHGAQPQSSSEFVIVALAALFLITVVVVTVRAFRRGPSHDYIAGIDHSELEN